ncbi:MAG: ring-cleaving dioxygenase [Gemmatimonadaceae bacterium]|jgi:catechol 2,3-dioxygenase-like lactoylglutathione lyase family enzyme
MTFATAGIHHVTAITGNPQQNVDFYAGVLGLRLVKRTVNFDDPTTYHFYFGDETGSPGTLITFFVWPGAKRGRAGAGQVAVTSFAIPPRSLGYWIERLIRYQVQYELPQTRFDEERVIALKDPDGLLLELVAHPSAESLPPAIGGQVEPEHSIRGLHSVTLWEDGHELTSRLLIDSLGFRMTREQGSIYRFMARDGARGSIVDVRLVPGLWAGVTGAGAVHHVALRARNDAEQVALRGALATLGSNVTPPLDRQYFRSVYFREPGGVLLEIATDGPGFTVDEPMDTLGLALKLPPWLEDRRFEIEALLPDVQLPLRLRGPAG